MIEKTLFPVETSRLAELEAVVEKGLETFQEVGAALLEIRDSRLYRATHKTFELYCRERWSMSARHANRLVSASKLALEMGPVGPKTEREARALTTRTKGVEPDPVDPAEVPKFLRDCIPAMEAARRSRPLLAEAIRILRGATVTDEEDLSRAMELRASAALPDDLLSSSPLGKKAPTDDAEREKGLRFLVRLADSFEEVRNLCVWIHCLQMRILGECLLELESKCEMTVTRLTPRKSGLCERRDEAEMRVFASVSVAGLEDVMSAICNRGDELTRDAVLREIDGPGSLNNLARLREYPEEIPVEVLVQCANERIAELKAAEVAT